MANKYGKPTPTDSSMPVSEQQNRLIAGPRGPLLAQDCRLIKKPAHHPIPLARTNLYIGTRAANRTELLNLND